MLQMDMDYPGYHINAELLIFENYLENLPLAINATADLYIKRHEEINREKDYYEFNHIYSIAEDEFPRLIKLPLLSSIWALFENSIESLLSYIKEKEKVEEKLETKKTKQTFKV